MDSARNGVPEEAAVASSLFVKEILTLQEACQYMGISSSHMYKLTSKRLIPHYSPTGKLIYFKRSELDEWVLKSRRKPISEMDAEAGSYLRANGKVK